MKLYESGEDYLEAVLMLQKKNGMVRSVDLARHMEVSKPSVCHAVATLRDGGFLMMDEDHFLHLTDVGREVATAWHTLGFDTSMCRATSTERTIPRFFWRTRMVSR